MGKPVEYVIELHPGQAAVYNSSARFKVCAAGRRFGKSHFAAVKLGEMAMMTEWKGYKLTSENPVFYIAPTFDQAKRVMWPNLHNILGYAKQGGMIARENVNDGFMELISGRRIYIKGADNPDTLRGEGYHYVVLDEYADMKSTVWDEIIDPALMDVEGDALFIGTPKGKNHFYKLFMGAMEQKPGYDDWEAFHFTSMDNPFLSRKELERVLKTDTRPIEVVRQEIEASFISGGGKVLKPQWFPVEDRMPQASHGGHAILSDDDGADGAVPFHSVVDQGHYYITVDLAGFAKASKKNVKLDETAIAITYVTQEGWYVMDIQHGKWDTREVALRIIRSCSQYPGCRLGIEKGALMNAIGPYLEDEMRRFNRYITPEPLTHGSTKKLDRIVHALQGRAERGRIHLLSEDARASKAKEPWVQHFLDQAADFPDPLAHDDLLDALAYVDQMASVSYAADLDLDDWAPLDITSGY